MTKELGERLRASFIVSSVFSLTLFFFGPTHIYFTNIVEYASPFSKILPLFVGLSVLCALLLTMLGFLKNPLFEKAIALLFCFSFLLWLQGNVLVWNYGPLDGRQIDWDAGTVYGVIDSAIWAALIILALIMSARVCRIARGASMALILIQLISTLFVVTRAPDASHLHGKSAAPDETVFEFSPGKNVVIIILDSFQGDIFQEIIDESQHYRDVFEGFTYYRNALALYPTTFASVPSIISGRSYENTMPIVPYYRDVFPADSLPRILTENGYQVDLIGFGKIIRALGSTAPSSHELQDFADRNSTLREAAFIFDVTLFRYLPHFIKKYVYNNQSWRFVNLGTDAALGEFPHGRHRNSIGFMKKMAREGRVGSERNVFKLIHIWPPHLPIVLNERLEFEALEANRDNFKKQAKGSLELVNMQLEMLRRIGVYDDTLIFVLADHGIGWKVEMEENGSTEDSDDTLSMQDRIKGRALPLFLVKPFMATEKLKISDAPVSLSDVAGTIVSELGLEAEIPGTSVLKIKDSDVRHRRYLHYEWEWAHWGVWYQNTGYLPPLREYTVSGPSWLDESWRPTYKLFTFEGVKNTFPRSYRYGTTIVFGKRGNSMSNQGWGWSYPETGFTRTDQKKASLIIPIGKTESNLQLKAVVQPFIVPGRVDRQRVRIFLGGRKAGEWVLTRNRLEEQTVIIPNDYIEGDVAEIILELPDAVSPASLDISRDERALSIRMHSIVLTEIAATATPFR